VISNGVSELVAVDIGGTHARFALAEVAGGKVVSLGPETTLRTAEYASFQTAWEAFGERLGRARPKAAAIAVAGPVQGEIVQFTNNPWIIRPALVNEKLGVERHVLINDFAAVGHAVAQADLAHFVHICGPDTPLPDEGTISVVGPGTGGYRVSPTEGGHIDFAPLDAIEDAIMARLRDRYRRVSVERIVAGPGLADIHATLARLEGKPVLETDDKALWALAMTGEDSLAAAALDRFCLALGSVAGDLALAQGASATVIAGGLGLRLRDHLVRSGFAERYTAKGRFAGLMAALPVKLIVHPQPGLLGAAAAFAQAYPA
jgi:glucokinase